MKKKPTPLRPAAAWQANSAPAAPFRAVQESEFERLKAEMLREKLKELWEPEFNSVLRGVANEAAALAWVTPYPLLVFPGLFEEKTAAAMAHADRQDWIFQRSRELLAV
jgi:hypothetical protein